MENKERQFIGFETKWCDGGLGTAGVTSAVYNDDAPEVLEVYKSLRPPLLPSSTLWSIEQSAMARIESAMRRIDLSALAVRSDLVMRGDGANIEGSTAVIPIMGPMDKRLSLVGMFMGFASTDLIRRQVEAAAADPAVKTIVLRIDSPGGSVDGLDDLGDTIFRARETKRVIAQVDGTMASAALYAGVQANEVRAGRMNLVGSIGTRMVLWDMSKMFEAGGVRVIPVDTGIHKSAGEPGTVVTAEQIAEFQRIVNGFFGDFTKAIQRGRGMSAAAVKDVADGRVWFGHEAKGLGLVDKIATFDETMAGLRQREANRKATVKMALGSMVVPM